ncbi:MAG TPA: DUF1854 domain-containing protein [Armatimonadota bacterium]|nr:DUF1854 domain-containing protein [Armatimonadota bacterium]
MTPAFDSPSRPTVLLDPQAITIRRDRHRGVKVRLHDGTTAYRVRLVEAFPVTRRRRFIILCDRDGQEIGILEDPKLLDPESAEVVRTALDRSYFLSRVTAIHRIEERYGTATWHVTTDRGPRVFEVRSRSESVWWLGASRILIKDAHGNRYEIPNLDTLDPRSRTLAELHI